MGCKLPRKCSGGIKELRCGHTVCEEFARSMLNGSVVQMICPVCSEAARFETVEELKDVADDALGEGQAIGGSERQPSQPRFAVQLPSPGSRIEAEPEPDKMDSDEVFEVEAPEVLAKRQARRRDRAVSPKQTPKVTPTKHRLQLASKSAPKESRQQKGGAVSKSRPKKKARTSRRKKQSAANTPKLTQDQSARAPQTRSKTTAATKPKKTARPATVSKKPAKKTAAKSKPAAVKTNRIRKGKASNSLKLTGKGSKQSDKQSIKITGNHGTININQSGNN